MPPRLSRWTPAAILVIAGSSHSLAAGPFGASFEYSALDGTNGFVCNGIDTNDQSGSSVSEAGDVNGDGIDDLIIGAFAGQPSGFFSGESYVVFGGPTVGAGGVIEMSALNGTNGFVCNGIDAFDSSGISVADAGDVNGDGIDDLLIGAVGGDPNASYSGESYVVFGAVGIGAGGSIELSSLNGADGFVLNGISADDMSGLSGASAGDVNNDGIGDLIIGARGVDGAGPNTGESYVVFGSNGIGAGGSFELSALDGTNGFVCSGINTEDLSGIAVSGAGDVNGDGFDDVIIGAHYGDANGAESGESYVVFGSAGPVAGGAVALSALNGTNGFLLRGIDIDDRCGISVSGAGDVNGDGVDDLIVGAFLADPNGAESGESYVVFGGVGIGAGGAIELSSLNGANGFVLNGSGTNDNCGRSVSDAGDVNNDGFGDVIIGASAADTNGGFSGETYVVFGGPGVGASGSIELASLNGADGFVLNGIDVIDQSGFSASGAGDINNDGVDDIIIGARGGDPNGQSFAGESYVVFGKASFPSDLNDDDIVDTADLGILIGAFGSAGPAGDINCDGVVDTADLGILIGSFGMTGP